MFLPPGGSQFQRFGPSSEFRIFCFWPNREILICQCFMIFLAVSEGFRGFPKVPEGPRRSSKVPEGFQKFSKFPNFSDQNVNFWVQEVSQGTPKGAPRSPKGALGSPLGASLAREEFEGKTSKLAEAFDENWSDRAQNSSASFIFSEKA